MITEKELLAKKKEIERTKVELSELKGEEKALLKQLNEDWGINSLAEAKNKIITFEKEIKQLSEEIEEKTQELEETYLSEEDE